MEEVFPQYRVGQPVLSNMSPESTYQQETGPQIGEPVVRGIVTSVFPILGGVDVWWEECTGPLYCTDGEVKSAD